MKKKTLTIAIALVLVVALAVGATYAYLTASSGPVTNTFTVGTVIDANGFVLKEHEVAYNSANGTYDYVTNDGKTVETDHNTYSQLAPKMEVPKDPFIAFRAEVKSPAYVFVEIVDTTDKQITYDLADGWTKLDGVTGNNGGTVYAYKDKITSANYTTNLPILANNKVAVADSATSANLSDATLKFYGYLCQATGFTSAKEAFTNCFGTANP